MLTSCKSNYKEFAATYEMTHYTGSDHSDIVLVEHYIIELLDNGRANHNLKACSND